MNAPLGERPTRARYVVMAMLCVLSFLTYFDRVCLIQAKPDIQRDLGITDDHWGIILSAFWLAYALFEIPSGWLGDRMGARTTLTRIVFAWSLFTALSGAATGFISLFLYRFSFGAGEAGAYPNMARIQSRWLPAASRARAGGLLWLLARWGGAFSPLIFSSLLGFFDSTAFQGALNELSGLHFISGSSGWRWAFALSGLIGFVWCVLFVVWFRDDPAEHPAVNSAELRLIAGGSPLPKQDARHGEPGVMKALFMCPSLWALAFLYLCGSFGWSFFVSRMPEYFRQVHHVEYKNSVWISMMPLFWGGIACLVGGWMCDRLVRRLGRKWLGRAVFPFVGYSVSAISMLLLPLAETPWRATLLLTLASVGFDFGQGANWATFVDIGGKYAGSVTGFINTFGNMGNVLQPILGHLIVKTFSWNALFLLFACAYLVAASMWFFIDPTRKFYQPA